MTRTISGEGRIVINGEPHDFKSWSFTVTDGPPLSGDPHPTSRGIATAAPVPMNRRARRIAKSRAR